MKKAAKLDAASKFKSMQANARVFKHYRSKFMKVIADTIKDKFDAAYVRDKNDPTAFLENLGWIYQDLIVIERDVVACFLKTGTFIRTWSANTTRHLTQHCSRRSQMRLRS